MNFSRGVYVIMVKIQPILRREFKMRPSFTSSAATLLSSLALLSGCGEAELTVKFNSKTTDNSSFKSTVTRLNDHITVEVQSLKPEKPAERFEFKCSEQPAIEAAYSQAAAEHARLSESVRPNFKDINPDTINEMIARMGKVNQALQYSGGKVDALDQARKFCNPSEMIKL